MVTLNRILAQVSIGVHCLVSLRIALGLQIVLDTRYASLEFQSWERWVTTEGHTQIAEQSTGQGARWVKIGIGCRIDCIRMLLRLVDICENDILIAVACWFSSKPSLVMIQIDAFKNRASEFSSDPWRV